MQKLKRKTSQSLELWGEKAKGKVLCFYFLCFLFSLFECENTLLSVKNCCALRAQIIKLKTRTFAKSLTVGICTEVVRKVIRQIYVGRATESCCLILFMLAAKLSESSWKPTPAARKDTARQTEKDRGKEEAGGGRQSNQQKWVAHG